LIRIEEESTNAESPFASNSVLGISFKFFLRDFFGNRKRNEERQKKKVNEKSKLRKKMEKIADGNFKF
jgi:hypothetical protein